jgi:WD40 repeat protein
LPFHPAYLKNRNGTLRSFGTRVLAGGWDKTLRLWDVKTGKLLARFEQPVRIWSLAVAPGARYALTGSWDAKVRWYRLPKP